jgi:hypothetical protein
MGAEKILTPEEIEERLQDLLEAQDRGWHAGFKAGQEFALNIFNEKMDAFEKGIAKPLLGFAILRAWLNRMGPK